MAKKKRGTRAAGKKPVKKPAKKTKRAAKVSKASKKKAAPKKKASKRPAKPAKRVAAKKAAPKKSGATKGATKSKAATKSKSASKSKGANNQPRYQAPARSPLRGSNMDDFVSALPDWQRDIVQVVRKLVRDVAPDSGEAIKWGQPVFEVNGPFCYLKPFTTYVNFGFWRGNDLPDPRGILEGGGERMRHVKLTTAADVPRDALASFIRLSAELNRACGSPDIPQATEA